MESPKICDGEECFELVDLHVGLTLERKVIVLAKMITFIYQGNQNNPFDPIPNCGQTQATL